MKFNKNTICLIAVILTILFLTVMDSRGQFGFNNVAVVGSFTATTTSSGGGSETVVRQNVYNANQACGLADGIGHYRTGIIGYTNTATIGITDVEFLMTYVAGDISSKTFKAHIYTLTGNALNTLLGSSGTITGNNSWSHTTNKFHFAATVSVSANTRIAIFVAPDQAGDNSNYARIDVQDTDVFSPGSLATWNSSGGIELNATTNDPWISIFYQ